MDVSYRTICDSPSPSAATKCHLQLCETECIACASGSRLQIYTYTETGLNLIWEKNFWANIFAVFSHRVGEFDALILGCDYNKVIILQSIGGIDMQETEFHSFDVEDQATCARSKPMMVKDPEDTCIALIVAEKTIFFLTLCQCGEHAQMDRPKAPVGQHSTWDVITGAIMQNFTEMYKPAILRVRDIKFLEGYKRPTLAIMHEPIPTWSVRLPIQKSTVCVSLVSPLLIEREVTIMSNETASTWMSRPLPHNSYGILPVLAPHGGFLVLSKNAIIYMTHTSGIAYGLNEMARLDDECPFEISGMASEPVELFTAVSVALDTHNYLLLVNQHEFAILTMHDNGIEMIGMSLTIYHDLELHPSLLFHYKDNLIFSGSMIHDSMMLGVDYEMYAQEDTFLSDTLLTETQQKLFLELYQELPRPIARKEIKSINIQILSRIYQLGTVACATPFINFNEAAVVQGNEEAISMAFGSGFKKTGCLHYLRCALTPRYLSDFNVSEANAAFSSSNLNVILFSQAASTVIFLRESEQLSYNDITEKVRNVYATQEPTIAAFDYNNSFIQVTKSALRVINKLNQAQIWSIPQNAIDIKAARCSGSTIALIINFNQSNQVVYLAEGKVDSNGIPVFNELPMAPHPQTGKIPSIYRIALFKDYLFMLQNNNSLHIYSISQRKVLVVFEQMRYFLDVIYRGQENISIMSQQPIVFDMNLIDIGSMLVLVFIFKEGNTILYQFCPQNQQHDYGLKRIKTRKLTSFGKGARPNAIIQFSDINGISGGFITGGRPMFLLSESGYPRVVPSPTGMFFAQVNSTFVVGDSQIAHISDFGSITEGTQSHLIDGCVVSRVHIGQTPRQMTFAASWHSIILLSSLPVEFTHEGERQVDQEADLTPHYQRPPTPPREVEPSNLPIAYEEQYELRIVTENGISEVLQFEKHEYGNAVAFVRTSDNYQNPNSTLSEYLAVGSGFMCHEERLMRGKLAIYKGTLVHSEEGKNEYKLQELIAKEQQAPVTAICELDGYIAAFAGTQLQMIMFFNEQVIKVASILNGHFFTSQLLSLKKYMLFVDTFKGFQIVRWRKYGNKLITMAKDFQTHLPLGGAILTDNGVFSGVVFDESGNAQIFDIDEYAIPVDAFVVRSIFHIGCRATSSGHFPIKGQSETGGGEIRAHLGWFASDHGKFGVFIPISDDAERRRLCMLQASYEKLLAGLSHSDFRWGKFQLLKNHELYTQSPRLVVDMDLMLDFIEMQPDMQRQCIKSYGRNTGELYSSLGELYSITNIFE